MRNGRISFGTFAVLCSLIFTSSCANVNVPDPRNVNIPSPQLANERSKAINERPDSVMYLPLGEDVLVPEVVEDDKFPSEMVGPFELRGETLAGALQLILADYDISLAFETNEGLTRKVTVANLRGDLGKVVHQVCSLANLYCSYEDGTITVKDKQTFTVTLPPIGAKDETTFMDDVSKGLGAILNEGNSNNNNNNNNNNGNSNTTTDNGDPIVDPTTRTIVYSATQRTADIATRYFQRLRANTAMIVFETYIWEVSLNSGNSAGINWTKLASYGKFNSAVNIKGSVGADFTSPISIGLPTTEDATTGTPDDLVQFLSQFGAVKTISQPQITVLSGSKAELRVADTRNYVSQIATTLDQGQSTTSVNTDSVDTGFTLTIGSTWDKATVYANVDIELTDVKQIDDFTFADGGTDGASTTIQLPQTSERQLSTQIRIRPGDAVLMAGLVRENDNYDTKGIGFMKPIVPDSRTAQTKNLELVIMLRPRVVVYTASDDKRYVDFANKKHLMAEEAAGIDTSSVTSVSETPAHAPLPVQPVAIVPPERPSTIGKRISPVTAPVPIEPIVPVAPVAAIPLSPPPAAVAVTPVSAYTAPSMTPLNDASPVSLAPSYAATAPVTAQKIQPDYVAPPAVSRVIAQPSPAPASALTAKAASRYATPSYPQVVPAKPAAQLAAPAPVVPVVAAPPVYPAPPSVAPAPTMPTPAVVAPVYAPAPVTPSWEKVPASSSTSTAPTYNEGSDAAPSRFKLGSGFVSKTAVPSETQNAAPQQAVPASSVYEDEASDAMPLYKDVPAAAAPAKPVSSAPLSPYETNDYYTPKY